MKMSNTACRDEVAELNTLVPAPAIKVPQLSRGMWRAAPHLSQAPSEWVPLLWGAWLRVKVSTSHPLQTQALSWYRLVLPPFARTSFLLPHCISIPKVWELRRQASIHTWCEILRVQLLLVDPVVGLGHDLQKGPTIPHEDL